MPSSKKSCVFRWHTAPTEQEARRACEGVFIHYYQPLFQFLKRYTRADNDLIEDAVQDTFFQLLATTGEQRASIQLTNVDAYLRTIALNMFRNRLCRDRARREVPLEHALKTIDVERNLLLASLDDPADHQVLLRELWNHRSLPRGEREALQLVLEGFTYAEIAGILGTTENAIKQRVLSLKRRLRALVGRRAP